MKKVYGKPDIVFENFALSANIALNCGNPSLHTQTEQCYVYTNSADRNSCNFIDGGVVVFTDYAQDCFVISQDGKYGNLCYHVPEDDLNMFSSQ